MARRPRRPTPGSVTYILDAGAVIGLSRADRKLRSTVDRARARDRDMVVPMVVVTETIRGSGPRDAPVNLVLAGCAPSRPIAEPTARLAGRLLADAGRNNTVDALVVAEAIERAPSVVLTSDPGDLKALLGDHPGVVIARV